jgi:hypothetical protein
LPKGVVYITQEKRRVKGKVGGRYDLRRVLVTVLAKLTYKAGIPMTPDEIRCVNAPLPERNDGGAILEDGD